MAFIRAAGNAIESSDVTRYSVTRYIARSKFENRLARLHGWRIGTERGSPAD
jgi:hypothetical protein